MCWAIPRLASDQEGWARQQMARRSGMQEVSGLDAAHKDDRTYGKENPVQDMKWSIIVAVWAQFSLTSTGNSGTMITGTICTLRSTREEVFWLFREQ